MPHPKHIGLLVFPGAQSLNVCAAAAVFAAANDVAGKDVYAVRIMSAFGGPVTTMSAVTVMTDAVLDAAPGDFHTILLTGGGNREVEEATGVTAIRRWILEAAARCRRLASTSFPCTLALGRLGLLDNVRITTHWSAAAPLAAACPKTIVDPDVLYVEDRGIWTAAGVTSAMDMSLEMVARDLGEPVANQIAKRFVLTGRRPGDIAQVSTAIVVQEKLDHDFRGLIAWMHAHLAEPLDVMTLAARAGMSLRNFQRRFKARTGDSPARFLESMRLEHARTLLASAMPIKSIAAQCGYANAQQFSKAYVRRFGTTLTASRASRSQAAPAGMD